MSNQNAKLEKKEVALKDERDVKAFIVVMMVLTIVVAALTSGTYNGYHPNPNSVAITGFLAVVTIVMTAVWYREKYGDYYYER
ncbi:MAG: hypothetical protein ACP5UI_02390 [Thermoprotei archaeon]|nr:hypothetical protein [TACK group archaeon]